MESFVVKNEDLAYFWMKWVFGVTNDGGKTWAIFNVEEKPEIKSALNHNLIKKVEMEKTGNGKMYFNNYGKEKSGISFLTTKDFGKTWQKP